jgi:hypothetical protein
MFRQFHRGEFDPVDLTVFLAWGKVVIVRQVGIHLLQANKNAGNVLIPQGIVNGQSIGDQFARIANADVPLDISSVPKRPDSHFRFDNSTAQQRRIKVCSGAIAPDLRGQGCPNKSH